MTILNVHHRFRISCNGLTQSLYELWFPLPDVTIAGPKLLIQVPPANPGFPVEVVQSERQPNIDIKCSGAVFKLMDCRIPKWNWVPTHLVKEIAIQKHPIFEQTFLPALTVCSIMEKEAGLDDPLVTHHC